LNHSNPLHLILVDGAPFRFAHEHGHVFDGVGSRCRKRSPVVAHLEALDVMGFGVLAGGDTLSVRASLLQNFVLLIGSTLAAYFLLLPEVFSHFSKAKINYKPRDTQDK
jgi:hypothetical protein